MDEKFFDNQKIEEEEKNCNDKTPIKYNDSLAITIENKNDSSRSCLYRQENEIEMSRMDKSSLFKKHDYKSVDEDVSEEPMDLDIKNIQGSEENNITEIILDMKEALIFEKNVEKLKFILKRKNMALANINSVEETETDPLNVVGLKIIPTKKNQEGLANIIQSIKFDYSGKLLYFLMI